MKSTKKKWFLCVFFVLILVLAGCSTGKDGAADENTSDKQPSEQTGNNQSNEQSGDSNNEPAPEPITLVMSGVGGGGEPSFEFTNVVKPFVEKKFPHITMEYAEDMKMDELIVAGKVPDIITSGYANVPSLLERAIPLDLNPLVKKHNFNLDTFIPEALNASKLYSNENELNSLPFDINYFALFYNKEIFDQFGIDYPVDNMTWKETIDIAKNVTRSVDGRQIGGLQVNSFGTFARGLAMPLVDPATEKAMINTDGFLRVTNTILDIHGIPGNEYVGKHRVNFVEGNTAMLAYWANSNLTMMEDLAESGSFNMDWDLVSYPRFEGNEGNIEITVDAYVVSRTTNHPDEAFKVVAYLAASEEVQLHRARTANMPPIEIDGIENTFGVDRPILEGKNVAGLFKTPALNNHVPTQYDSYVEKAYNQTVQMLLKGEISDARTALQKAEENANMDIAAAK